MSGLVQELLNFHENITVSLGQGGLPWNAVRELDDTFKVRNEVTMHLFGSTTRS